MVEVRQHGVAAAVVGVAEQAGVDLADIHGLDAGHKDQVVTRTMLLEQVWDHHFDPQTNVIDVHISRLRQKIDKDFDPPLLHTVRGAGYMLRAG